MPTMDLPLSRVDMTDGDTARAAAISLWLRPFFLPEIPDPFTILLLISLVVYVLHVSVILVLHNLFIAYNFNVLHAYLSTD